MKKTITEVETAIENRIAELEEEYELDIYDRNDIREEEYQKAGWRHDPRRASGRGRRRGRRLALPQHGRTTERGRHEHEGFLLRNPKRLPQQKLGFCLVSPVLVWYDTQNRC